MSSFTPAGSGGIPLSVSLDSISSYSNVTVSVPTANTEVQIVIPTNAIYIAIYNETAGVTKLAFISGQSGTNYWPVYPGFREELNKKEGVSMSLYVQCPRNSQTIRIIYGLV